MTTWGDMINHPNPKISNAANAVIQIASDLQAYCLVPHDLSIDMALKLIIELRGHYGKPDRSEITVFLDGDVT